MLELGQSTVSMHRAMGKLAALHANVCFFFGQFAPHYAEGAKAAGGSYNPKAKRHFRILEGSLDEMVNTILPYLNQESAVLIKASRALHAEDILRQIKEAYIP
jgi:UDP-N-acetylmuramyl pentapeptide synthase